MYPPSLNFNPYAKFVYPTCPFLQFSNDDTYVGYHKTPTYEVSIRINAYEDYFILKYEDLTGKGHSYYHSNFDFYCDILFRLPLDEGLFGSIDWSEIILHEEMISKHLLLQYLKAGVNPFTENLDESIFQPFKRQETDTEDFKQIWDAITPEQRAKEKERLRLYMLENDGVLCDINPDIFNYIQFSEDQEEWDYHIQNNQGKLVHTRNSLLAQSALCARSQEIEREIIEEFLSNFPCGPRMRAFLNIYIEIYMYMSFEFENCFNDLRMLNDLLKQQWEKENPGKEFPFLSQGVHFELEYRNDLVLAKPTALTKQLQAVNYHKLVLKTILNYLYEKGVITQKEYYYKFVGFIPSTIANTMIQLEEGLTFFTEAYTAPYTHGPLTHYVQLFLLTVALTNNRIPLQNSNEVFTPKEIIKLILHPDFYNLHLWQKAFDSYRPTNQFNGLLTCKLNLLQFCNPADVVSVIRESFNDPHLSMLSNCLICSELKKLIKYAKIKEIDLQTAYTTLTRFGPVFNMELPYEKEIAFRTAFPQKRSVINSIQPASPAEDPFLIQVKRLTSL